MVAAAAVDLLRLVVLHYDEGELDLPLVVKEMSKRRSRRWMQVEQATCAASNKRTSFSCLTKILVPPSDSHSLIVARRLRCLARASLIGHAGQLSHPSIADTDNMDDMPLTDAFRSVELQKSTCEVGCATFLD